MKVEKEVTIYVESFIDALEIVDKMNVSLSHAVVFMDEEEFFEGKCHVVIDRTMFMFLPVYKRRLKIMKTIKDIIYGDEDQGLLGVEDLGDGYKLAIVNVGGTHHCAYVQFPGIESIGSYDDIWVDAEVHGGFTFLGSLSKYELEGRWLGWDYAHFGDYMFRQYRSCYPDEKMWTTDEVVKEGIDVLKAIKDGKWRKGDEDAIH